MTEVEDFQALDTTVVQVRSVLNFMYALGYTLDGTVKTGRFVTEQKFAQANRYIGVHTAIRLHNMKGEDWAAKVDTSGNTMFYPTGVNLKNGFNPIGLRLAFASKLVPQVKFSVTRNGDVVTQDHLIRPLNESVRQLVEA